MSCKTSFFASFSNSAFAHSNNQHLVTVTFGVAATPFALLLAQREWPPRELLVVRAPDGASLATGAATSVDLTTGLRRVPLNSSASPLTQLALEFDATAEGEPLALAFVRLVGDLADVSFPFNGTLKGFQ